MYKALQRERLFHLVMSYFLGDCRYVSEKIINTFVQRGFHTIGALKTNRLLYPSGMKKKPRELAAELSVTHREFDLVTVKKRNYYVTGTRETSTA
ncbi:MAG: hypothetical protein ACLT1J_10990 [Mediterraneibacter gnavus]